MAYEDDKAAAAAFQAQVSALNASIRELCNRGLSVDLEADSTVDRLGLLPIPILNATVSRIYPRTPPTAADATSAGNIA